SQPVFANGSVGAIPQTVNRRVAARGYHGCVAGFYAASVNCRQLAAVCLAALCGGAGPWLGRATGSVSWRQVAFYVAASRQLHADGLGTAAAIVYRQRYLRQWL